MDFVELRKKGYSKVNYSSIVVPANCIKKDRIQTPNSINL